jgi:hypothetical protein
MPELGFLFHCGTKWVIETIFESAVSMMLFAITRARIVLTLHISLAKMLSPPSKIYAVCVSRCAFLSLKMTRRWRNSCMSGWNKSNSRYKWSPMERRRNNWLPTKHTIS